MEMPLFAPVRVMCLLSHSDVLPLLQYQIYLIALPCRSIRLKQLQYKVKFLVFVRVTLPNRVVESK